MHKAGVNFPSVWLHIRCTNKTTGSLWKGSSVKGFRRNSSPCCAVVILGTITELIWQPASKHILDAYKIKTLSDANDAALFDQSTRFIIHVIALEFAGIFRLFSCHSRYHFNLRLKFKFNPFRGHVLLPAHFLSIQPRRFCEHSPFVYLLNKRTLFPF